MTLCRKLPEKFGGLLSEDQLKQIEELGLLADLDDQVCTDTQTLLLAKTLSVLVITTISCAFC